MLLLNKKFRLFVATLIVGNAIYFAFNMVMKSLVHNKKEVVVPSIVGKNIYDALDKLSRDGFGLQKEAEEKSQNFKAGIVLRQKPAVGMKVREGRIIRVTISQGREIICVPNIVGQTVRSADITLRYSSLIIGEVSRKFSLVTEKDIIISQDIVAGSKTDKTSLVNIVVSDGFPPENIILMPDFMNKTLKEAKMWALHYGINLNIINEEISANNLALSSKNIIIKQFPKYDTDITSAKNIDLYIATNTV